MYQTFSVVPPLPFERPTTGETLAGVVGAQRLAAIMTAGQALERKGQQQDARRLYETALRDGTAASSTDSAQLLRWVARTFIQESQFETARDCALAALAVSERSADEVGRAHAENILAIVEWKHSNIDEAERLFRCAHTSAHRSGESQLASLTASNLGVIASVRGDDRAARRHFEMGLASARSAGLADQAIAALLNLGLLHLQLHELAAASRALDEARELAMVIGEMGMLITVELGIAKLRIRQERYAEAGAACASACGIAASTGTTHADGEAAHVEGLVAQALGETTAAEQHFLRAEEIAIQRRDLILQGETARELAGLFRQLGRNRQALQRLNQAHRIFAQLRAGRELADVDRRTLALESDFLEVVRKWGESIESKDIYTQGHCVRVADLACALWARVTRSDATSLFWFRIGALLHDVGKLMVPAEVLNKHGALTDEEWALVRGHPVAGVELLADIEFPWDVRPIVESHHEKWDGTGYPHGLAGEAIPLPARVLCIADVYDALTSRRAYREPSSHEEAMREMRLEIGHTFDPTLFVHFEAIVRDGGWSSGIRAAPLGAAV